MKSGKKNVSRFFINTIVFIIAFRVMHFFCVDASMVAWVCMCVRLHHFFTVMCISVFFLCVNCCCCSWVHLALFVIDANARGTFDLVLLLRGRR
jgi:hypothetical protein